MKNYLIVGLICLVVALAFGAAPVRRAINGATNRGTLRGVETCMDYSRTELLSHDALKAVCVSSFQVRLYLPDLATGKAGPSVELGKASWSGKLENKTTDHVTTWIQILVSIFDAEGVEKKVFAETQIWIPPLDKADFRVELPDIEPKQLDALKFCDNDDKAPKDCMAWGVYDVMGLAI